MEPLDSISSIPHHTSHGISPRHGKFWRWQLTVCTLTHELQLPVNQQDEEEEEVEEGGYSGKSKASVVTKWRETPG